MKVQYSNNAATVSATAVEVGHEVLIVSNASPFPILSPGDWMYVTVEEEVVKVTATSGNVFTTSPFNQAHGLGSSVEGRITVAVLNDSQDADIYDSAGDEPAAGTMRHGEIYANSTDKQIGIGNVTGDPSPLVAVRLHSAIASYVAGDLVSYVGDVWKANLTHVGVWDSDNWSPVGSESRYTDLGGLSGVADIDVSKGEVFRINVTGSLTVSFSGFNVGKHKTVMLILNNGGSNIVWDTAIQWPEATAPDLSVAGKDRLVFASEDGGATVDGGLCGVSYA